MFVLLLNILVILMG